MDKLSGILPASARTQVADVSVSQPARPGAPALGRPMGKNSLGDRVTLSKKMEELRQTGQMPALDDSPVYKNPAEAKKLKVIEDLNAKFFANNPKNVAREGDLAQSEEVLGKNHRERRTLLCRKGYAPSASSFK